MIYRVQIVVVSLAQGYLDSCLDIHGLANCINNSTKWVGATVPVVKYRIQKLNGISRSITWHPLQAATWHLFHRHCALSLPISLPVWCVVGQVNGWWTDSCWCPLQVRGVSTSKQLSRFTRTFLWRPRSDKYLHHHHNAIFSHYT